MRWPSAASSSGRAQVGDRHVLSMLNETGGTLGGETSGHILCLDKTTTGDGLISALQVLAVMKSTGAGLAELTAPMRRYPQVLMNVRVAGRFDPMTKPSVLAVVDALQRQFDGRGRIVLRASGTEPVIRVMVEGYDAAMVKKGAREIAAAVEAAAGGRRRPAASGDGGGRRPGARRRRATRRRPEPQTQEPGLGLQLRVGAANLRRLYCRAVPKVAYASSGGRG